MDRIFGLELVYENTQEAVEQRKRFLEAHNIGICDIVAAAKREKIDASDLGMQEVVLRDLFKILEGHPTVDTLLFTGGNSKNGPEYFFRRYLKQHGLSLRVLDDQVPRIHTVDKGSRQIRTVSLTAPSGAANRAVGALPAYKRMKQEHPELDTIDFRVRQYRPFFMG